MFEEDQKQSSQQPQEPATQGSSPVPPAEPEAAQPAVPAPESQPEAGLAPETPRPTSPLAKSKAGGETAPLAEAPEPTEVPTAPLEPVVDATIAPEAIPEPAAELPQQKPVPLTPVQSDSPAQTEQPEDILESVSSSPVPSEPVAAAPVPEAAPESTTELPQQQPFAPMPEQPNSQPLSQPSATKFATPELAKKEIIKEADEGEDSEKETVRVMADKFRKSKPKKPKSDKKKGKFLIILLVVVILIIAGGIGFYFWAQNYSQKLITPEPQLEAGPPLAEIPESATELPPQEPVEPVEPVEEEKLEVIEEPVLSPAQTLRDELKNTESEVVISWAELYLPEGSIDTAIKLEINGELDSEELEGDYKIIGGLYQVSYQKINEEEIENDVEDEDTLDIVFKNTANLKIFYHQDLIEDIWEKDLVIGYLKDNLWTPLLSSIDEEINILTISLDFIPAKTLAIIVAKEKLTPKIEIFQIAPEVQSSTDTDSDGLTDIEETIYHTEINNPDSDTDTTPDGQEVFNLTDPNQQIEGAQLAASGLINVYTNPTYSYSFFYPSSWLARAIPETNNQEVLVITNTGEFFSITVENNPEELKPVEWYLRQSPNVDQSLLYSTIVNNQEAVWNPERLTLYIGKDSRVYILSYNVGTEKQANFKTSFNLMINGFQFVIQPQGRADGTLIKYPDQPGVYLIEAGKKRAFASGEIFERIGFKWEDVIEVPYNETYIDGDLVTGYLDGTLIKYSDEPGIYLIESGKKRAFASGQIFETLGFKWEDVIEVLADEIYPDGPIIDSNITVILGEE